MKKLNELFNELSLIQDDSYYNVSNIRVLIKMNTKEFGKHGAYGNKHFNQTDYIYKETHPYCVEIWGVKKLVYYDRFTNRDVQDFNIATAYGESIEEAIDLALNKYKVCKGDYSNKNYAYELYKKSVNRGYESTFEQWVKDMEEYNDDRMTGKHIIERAVYDDNGNMVKSGVYKRYPKGINKIQDLKDKKRGER